MQYQINKVVASSNPEAKKWLWECWGDIRVSPSAAKIGVQNGYLSDREAKEYLYFVYFNDSSELKSILEKIKARVSIPANEFQNTSFSKAVKNIFYSQKFFDNILEKFKKAEQQENNVTISKNIQITKAGEKLLKARV